MKKGSMFQKTRIRLTILNSLVFIILIGVLGSIIYSYTYNRIYNEVDKSIGKSVQHRKNSDDKKLLKKIRGYPPIGDPRITELIWVGNTVEIGIENGKRRFIFEDNLEKFSPKKLGTLQDIEVQGQYFRTFAFQQDTKIVQIVRDITAEKEMLHTLFLILAIGCSVGSLCAVGIGFFLAGRALIPIQNSWEKQQQFVSDASHELRTPLAVIQSKTDVLFQSPSATIEEKAMDISTISKECRRLSKLVTNLLLLARSDSNQIEMDKKIFEMDKLLEEIVDPYKEIASYQEKEMILKVEHDISFMGDRERIHQMMVILLDNAMKYTNGGGHIQIDCTQTSSSIRIRVKDDGIGVKDEDIPKLFDRFYQGDKARSASEGAGLGLSIANWIVEKHYGKILVDSKWGEGTCFEVNFPKNQRI
ncbi:sensor histidine kinase [Bacillus wiedmannii]|uniref:sensor histidine kinase n=1 Tax=Bacillus TaxID=1386 RepID=UPI00069D1F0F|nr:sensor histidine kinase [Bacillus wiedmannii]PFY92479.1 sensor histidine kinase [Bacillus wiedmannii]PFZ57714.1 sensor histidine kinase [Bacillus wiedmannii]PGB78647.1 sensor histidine kinase [Bacillus wiedmannii]PGD03177.1 sensor histidine kinase [Bacillus wiedmannii]